MSPQFLAWVALNRRVQILIAHEALGSPREEPVGRSAVGGRFADVDRYLPRRRTHCSHRRCFQPRRLVPGRCHRDRWRADLGRLHEGHIKPVVGRRTHSARPCTGRPDMPGWSDRLGPRASTGRPVDNRSARQPSFRRYAPTVMNGERSRRRRARLLTRAERTAKRRQYEQPMWLPQPFRWLWAWLIRPLLLAVLKVLDVAVGVWH